MIFAHIDHYKLDHCQKPTLVEAMTTILLNIGHASLKYFFTVQADKKVTHQLCRTFRYAINNCSGE